MPTKNENESDPLFSGQDSLVGKPDNFSGHSTKINLPTKKRTGWIEYQKAGTKNPKRYARRRRWIKQNGEWVKTKPKRVKSIPPLTEEQYEQIKRYEEIAAQLR